MAERPDTERHTKRAVVDIGSNSVRLVIYDGARRAPVPICNEKALCGLGRDMTKDGRLNEEAVGHGLATLQRFRQVLAEHGDPPTRVIATAAVREAADGKAFVKKVKNLDFDVEIIAGEREAELAAFGVISYNPFADGIVGDLGGGSLELAATNESKLKNQTSLSIGPLRLMMNSGGNLEKAQSLIAKEIDEIDWIKPKKYKTLYAVGGAWRAIARIHMRLRSYPLSILHGYEVLHRDAIEICDLVSRQSRRSLEEIPGIPRRRIDTLPYAALVMKAVLLKMDAERICVSAGGVREGLIYNGLSAKEKMTDPLMEGAAFFADRLSPNPKIGKYITEMCDPLFPDETKAERRIRVAICALTDIGAFFHPDLRGAHAFDTALRAPFYAISHSERAMTACALYARYHGRRNAFPDTQAVGLLSWDEQKKALHLGLAMRFAATLAPKAPSILKKCTLSIDGDDLIFQGPPRLEPLLEGLPRRRLQSLASATEKKIVEIFED